MEMKWKQDEIFIPSGADWAQAGDWLLQQVSKDGKECIRVTYPKFKLEEEVVREVACPPSLMLFVLTYNLQ